MNIKHALPRFVVGAVLTAPIPILAADYSDTSRPPASQQPANLPAAMITLIGTVQQIDASNNSVQLKDANGALQTVKVDSTTELSRDGKSVQLAEVKEGDVLTIKNVNQTM